MAALNSRTKGDFVIKAKLKDERIAFRIPTDMKWTFERLCAPNMRSKVLRELLKRFLEGSILIEQDIL